MIERFLLMKYLNKITFLMYHFVIWVKFSYGWQHYGQCTVLQLKSNVRALIGWLQFLHVCMYTKVKSRFEILCTHTGKSAFSQSECEDPFCLHQKIDYISN